MSGTSGLPTGTVTFLFTDIEGSTRLLQRLGDGFPALVEEHHRVLRQAFGTSGGKEVSTEGDAFFVVFTSAPDAVRGAVEAQRALDRHAWGDGITVAVRMGLHTGVATLVGDNYGGIDVHRAARIASAAHGGQVLLSAATASLVERSLPLGVSLKELGAFRLKDIAHPEHLRQLCIDGLRTEFPAPRALDARLTNLPASLTGLVGRARERKEVAELLSANRLVTLTGPGGTGKTRLGIAVGEQVLDAFPDGVFLVLLAALEDPRLVASTIAHTLGLREQGTASVEEILQDHLAGKEILLILDNFEQVVDAAPVVPKLLAAGPAVRILVTSRTALRLSGEQQYPVPPLELPRPSASASAEALSGYEAIELFVQRARSALPGFELTRENATAVTEICRRLDGLPLAIELAAARTRIMSPGEISHRLDAGLSFLTSRDRDLPERQRTLRNAIGWSYDLLDETLQGFFRRLGVFAGSFGFEAAEEVTLVAEAEDDALEGLELLLDNSLLRRISTDDARTRFRMLQTIREFALDRLERSGEGASTRESHARWYLRYVEEAASRFTAGPEALDEMDHEHDNVRAVLRWSIDAGHADVAMRVGSAMWRYWQLRGHLAEGRRWLTEILALPAEPHPPRLRARALMALGSITYWQNDYEPTERHYRDALEILRPLDDEEGLQEALYNVGFLSLLRRDPGASRGVFDESRRIALRREDTKGLADTSWALAMAAIQAQDWDAARHWGAECGRLYEELGDLFGRGLAQFTAFQVARYTGQLREAREVMSGYMQEAANHDLGGYSTGLEMMAEIELLEGDLERALTMRAAAEAAREDYGGGSPVPLIDLSDIRRVASGGLSEERIEELWRSGRAMSAQESLAYALKDPQA